MIFLENLQAKDFPQNLQKTPKQVFLPITTFSEVLVVHYRPRACQKKYLQNMV